MGLGELRDETKGQNQQDIGRVHVPLRRIFSHNYSVVPHHFHNRILTSLERIFGEIWSYSRKRR